MTNAHSIARYLARYPNIAAAAYVAVVVAALLVVILAIVSISDGYRARDTSAGTLAELEQRASSNASALGSSAPAGSPFLQGQTATVATATLLQRVTDVIAHTKGSITSSEVDGTGGQSTTDRVKIIVACEIEERALQQLLYEIEAGAPYLFVDQLVAQAPESAGGRLRVVLRISGLWSGGK